MSSLELDEVDAVALAADVRVAARVRLLVCDDHAGRPGLRALEIDRDNRATTTGLVPREAGVDAGAIGVGSESSAEFGIRESREGALLAGRRLPVPVDPAIPR